MGRQGTAAAASEVEFDRAEQGARDRKAILDRLRAKKPVRSEYRVFLSDEPLQELRAARAELDAAQDSLLRATLDTEPLAAKRVERAQARHAAAVHAAEADSELLVFEAIPRADFNALLEAHEPTPEQRAKGRDYNPETLAPELIAATCVEPGFDSAEQVRDVLAGWNMAERESAFFTALGVCTTTRVGDLGKG